MFKALPIIDNAGKPQTYGSEFDAIYKSELNGFLMVPQDPVIDYNTGNKYTLYDPTDGIYNQDKLFENNNDAQEDQQKTSEQSLQRIRNTSGINRQLTETEKKYNLYTTNNFDIRFRSQLVDESKKEGSNIFSDFSQDHVNAVRKANENLIKEENLYETKATMDYKKISTRQNPFGKGSLASIGLEGLINLAKKEQQTQQNQQKFRNTFAGTTKETMRDKFDKMTNSKPKF